MFNKIARKLGLIKQKAILEKKYKNIPIKLRNNNIDVEVFDYVFRDKYHHPEKELGPNPVILDLGSNIGLSIVDYKLQYPGARIIGFELDKQNAAFAKENTALFGNDVTIVNKGIWYKKEKMHYSGNAADAYKLEELKASDNNDQFVETITISDVVQEYSLRSIDFIKMDIEGAELGIFQNDKLDWLQITKQIKIEVHYDKEMLQYFIDKLKEHGFIALPDTHHWSTVIGYRNES
jgi:FkbM family methyltransferase